MGQFPRRRLVEDERVNHGEEQPRGIADTRRSAPAQQASFRNPHILRRAITAAMVSPRAHAEVRRSTAP
jgi:hypothetical protein